MGAGRIAAGLLGAGGASAIAAYGSARSSYQPQPPVPGLGELWDWVSSGSDPLALLLLAFAAVSAGLSLWQAFTALSRKDVEDVVTTDGAQTRALVDEGIAQTWVEGQASEERDTETHGKLDDLSKVVRQIVANQQAEAQARGINAAKLVSLACRIVEKVADPAEAEQALHRAIDELLKLREEAKRGTNFGDEVDEAIRRIFAKVEADDLDGAAREQQVEFARLAEQVEEMRAAQTKMADTGLSVARLRYDAAAMAHWSLEKRKLAEGVDRLDLPSLRSDWWEWYDLALNRGSRLDMDVAILLARRSVEEATTAEDRAMCQNDLGGSLKLQGERNGGEGGIALLGEAVATYRAALEVRTKDELPVDWAMTQNNLGNALSTQGERLGGKTGIALLGEAVEAYRAALEVRTKSEKPVQWAMTQNNLGIALRTQGARLGGEAGIALLGEAVVACRAALEVNTKRELPVDWAMTQNTLGAALQTQGARLGGKDGLALLNDAVAACRAALEVNTKRELPVDWAMTQENIALAEESIGDLSDGEAQADHWRAAEAAVLLALEVYDPVNMPYDYGTAAELLTRIRAKLAGAG